MKRILITLGCLWSLSAVSGPAYAGNDGFLSNLKGLLWNVAQRTDLNGGIGYVMNAAPTDASVALPEHVQEWAANVGANVALNPATALYGNVQLGVDNRILKSEFGVTRHLWGGGK